MNKTTNTNTNQTTKTPVLKAKSKGGAPRENNNALRHGLATNKLPRRLLWAENRTNVLRRNLENAVLQTKGEISLTDASAINSALKWERHGILAATWLREQMNELSVTDKIRFSEIIAKASDARDKNIRLLGLDTKAEPWSAGVFDGDIKPIKEKSA